MEPEELARRIKAYCNKHGLSVWRFGKLAVNDGKLVQRLEAGGTITMATFQKIERQLERQPSAIAS